MVGTSAGTSARWPEVHRVAVEPAEPAVLSGGEPGTHRTEGGGVGFVPPLLQPDEEGRRPYDEVFNVTTAEAFAMARRAAEVEGIWGGPSTGANLLAAIRHAERRGSGYRILTAQCDSGLEYLGGSLYSCPRRRPHPPLPGHRTAEPPGTRRNHQASDDVLARLTGSPCGPLGRHPGSFQVPAHRSERSIAGRQPRLTGALYRRTQ